MLLVVLGFEQQLRKKLQICQNKTVRFIKNLGPRSHIGFLENSLNMLNVDFRVKQLRLSHVHKIFNGTGPLYLSEHFIKSSDVHHHFTRGSTENFVVPSVSGVAATTFNYSGIKDWNSLPSDVKQKCTSNGFKSAARQYLGIVVWLFLTMPRVCLQFVIVVFPYHTHLLS